MYVHWTYIQTMPYYIIKLTGNTQRNRGWDFQLTLTYPWYPIQDIQV